jgi:outer membrane protein assembly factor BamE (lipoprotein component of BamABCDE complex)
MTTHSCGSRVFRCTAFHGASMIILLLLCGMLLGACTEKTWRPANERIWTEAELKGLRGKTRDDIREFLGSPTGLYTTDAKGRWHYPHMKVEDPETQTRYEATVKIYFSQLGEQRATIIEITKRTD